MLSDSAWLCSNVKQLWEVLDAPEFPDEVPEVTVLQLEREDPWTTLLVELLLVTSVVLLWLL